MSRSATVSVIVPAHNAAESLRRTLDSARRQTLDAIEIIVVDDGSSDDTPAQLTEIAGLDRRVRLLHQANAGVAAARNRGIAAARGTFIAFLDADDLWDANHLETHVRRLTGDPDLALSFSAVRYVDAAYRPLGRVATPSSRTAVADLLATSPCPTASAIVVRAAAVAAVGGFDERLLSGAEDQEWLVRLRSRGFAIEGCADAWVSYRIDQGSMSSKLHRMLRGYSQMLDIVAGYEPDLVSRRGALFKARMSRHLAGCAIERGHGLSAARAFIGSALKISPRLLLHEPRLTLSILLQSWVPGFSAILGVIRRPAT